jgi:hypothetical protein
MSTTPAQGQFDIGRVISRLFGVLGRNFVTFLLLTLLLISAPTIAFGFLSLPLMASNPAAMFSATGLAMIAASVVVSVCSNAVLQGAIINGTVSDLAGKPASFGECLATGIRFIGPLIGIGIISSLGIGLASILLIVPGVLLALAWSIAAPVAVMERTGVFGAFDRSAVLTRNCRGAIFGLAVIYVVILLVVQAVVLGLVTASGGIATAATLTGPSLRNYLIIQTLANGVIETITALLSSAGIASVYYELRTIKDGVGAEQLAAVFD